MPMRALDRPALLAQLLILSAGADAFCVPPLSHRIVGCLATERQALVMNAGGGSPITELAALYEVMPLMTYDGWEHDVKVVEDLWAQGWTTAESIERSVERMRRRQCLHEGDRSDAVLQVLDGATQGLTYPGWEHDLECEQSRWVGGFVTAASIKLRVARMRRRQRLHDSHTGDQVNATSPTMTPPNIPAPAVCFLLTLLWFIIDAFLNASP